MAEEVLKIERHTNYITLALNRPEKRNAINIAMLEALDAAFTMIESDHEIRAVIVKGEGRGFCSGLDLRDVERAGGAGVGGGPAFAPDKILHRLQTLPVPVIAAIHGDALTAGLVIALLCDLRIAATKREAGDDSGPDRLSADLRGLPAVRRNRGRCQHRGNHVPRGAG